MKVQLSIFASTALGIAFAVIMFICGVALAWLGFLQLTLTNSIFPSSVLGSASIGFTFLGLFLLGKTITTAIRDRPQVR